MNESRRRTLVKALTYRIICVIVTYSVTYVILHNVDQSLMILILHQSLQTLSYFLHERGWARIGWGILTDPKDQAYWERNQLVAHLSKLYPAHLYIDPRETDEWKTCVCIHSPTGQLTWHVPAKELEHFKHLIVEPNHWDGHTTEEKYQRLSRIAGA